MIEPPDRKYGSAGKNNSWTGMVGMVQRRVNTITFWYLRSKIKKNQSQKMHSFVPHAKMNGKVGFHA